VAVIVPSAIWVRPARWLSAILAAGSAAAIVLVERGRGSVAASVFAAAADPEAGTSIASGIEAQITGVTVAGALALGAVLLLALAEIAARHQSRPNDQPWSAPLLALLPSSIGVVVYGRALRARYEGAAGIDPSLKSAHLREALVASHRWLDLARFGSWLAIGVITALVLVRARRGPVGDSGARLFTAGLLFVAGAISFAVTRSQASDHTPLTVLPAVVEDPTTFEGVPRLKSCPVQTQSLPLLRFRPEAVTLDGIPVDPRTFGDQLTVLFANWVTLNRGPSVPDTSALIIASRETPLERVLPYLSVRPDASWMVASIWPVPHPSASMGPIPRYQHCGRRFKLSESAPPISQYKTWGALAGAVDRSPSIFEAAPR